VLRSGDGPATAALRRAGVDLEAARRETRRSRRADDDSETGDHSLPNRRLPVSEPARKSFEQSLREAVGRDDRHLGVEHVLLALLCEREGAAVQALGRLGVAVGRLHRLLERTIADGAAQRPEPAVSR
jgi:ATP-dependent Clp protease ATP-binding subunit ClpA